MSQTPESLYITMLGTGSAFPERSYNTCFMLHDGARPVLLVDAGGGNDILNRLRALGCPAESVRKLFITHSHTDHILGAAWIVRAHINASKEGEINLTVYGNTATLEALDGICRLTLLPAHYRRFLNEVRQIDIARDPEQQIEGLRFQFFDVGSANVSQSGFMINLPDAGKIVCLGDEALIAENMDYARDAAWLLCGAFCLFEDSDFFQPYEKHHHTVRDVAKLAAEAKVRHLLIYHCEDKSLPRRQERYRAEAALYFKGRVFVPCDCDTLKLS